MEHLLYLIAKIPIRGRAFFIRLLVKYYRYLTSYPFKKKGYKHNLVLDLSDDAAIFILLNNGTIPHESGLLSVFRHIEDRELNFWDIGTNYGYYPWIFINEDLFNKIYCFEPNPKLSDMLKTSFNTSQSKVFINNCGLGEFPAKLSFMYDPQRSDLGTFSFKAAARDVSATFVNVDTLDNLRVKLGSPDVIKLDVEGFELSVLKGYTNLNVDYPIISLEWIQEFQDLSFQDLLINFDESWEYYFIGFDGCLYDVKNESCGSDLLFISRVNKAYKKILSLKSSS